MDATPNSNILNTKVLESIQLCLNFIKEIILGLGCGQYNGRRGGKPFGLLEPLEEGKISISNLSLIRLSKGKTSTSASKCRVVMREENNIFTRVLLEQRSTSLIINRLRLKG